MADLRVHRLMAWQRPCVEEREDADEVERITEFAHSRIGRWKSASS